MSHGRRADILKAIIQVILLAMFSATFFNQMITLVRLKAVSEAYQSAADILGERTLTEKLVMSGILVPIIEELIFRGVVYIKLKQILLNKNNTYYVSVIISGAASAVMFGAYHGNIVQFVYAFFMGIIIIFVYECGIIMTEAGEDLYMPGIFMAILFHMTSNIYVILMSMNNWLSSEIGIEISCIAGLMGMIIMIWQLQNQTKHRCGYEKL